MKIIVVVINWTFSTRVKDGSGIEEPSERINSIPQAQEISTATFSIIRPVAADTELESNIVASTVSRH